jgi:hypothetical protein
MTRFKPIQTNIFFINYIYQVRLTKIYRETLSRFYPNENVDFWLNVYLKASTVIKTVLFSSEHYNVVQRFDVTRIVIIIIIIW